MPFCVRYVNEDLEHQFVLRKDFLNLVSVKNMTGNNLANVIFETIYSLGINPKYRVGQGCDGVVVMNGNCNGVQAII